MLSFRSVKKEAVDSTALLVIDKKIILIVMH